MGGSKYRLDNIRREYGDLILGKDKAKDSPIEQFELWFEDILQTDNPDPTAMVLATVDAQGQPDTRVVLLKGIHQQQFIFYTNYNSAKAKQLASVAGKCALNFHWPRLARQIRVRGVASPITAEQSDAYFSSRPHTSQLSAIASPQSEVIASRAELESRLNNLIEQYGQQAVMRPEHWGGYAVNAHDIEFWQGRDNRLHDRLRYKLKNGQWLMERLAP